MRPTPWFHLDGFRVVKGKMASPPGADYGSFLIPNAVGQTIVVVASNAMPEHNSTWEHVSVSLKNRCPNWSEMAMVKDLFWLPEEAVMQLHPPRSQYVNYHPHVLHLWHPTHCEIPLPPSWTVGPRDGQSREDTLREAHEAMK
jgi:hypothetical protein